MNAKSWMSAALVAGAVAMIPETSQAATRVVVRGPVVAPMPVVVRPTPLVPVVVKPVVVAAPLPAPVIVNPVPVVAPVPVVTPVVVNSPSKVVVTPRSVRIRY